MLKIINGEIINFPDEINMKVIQFVIIDNINIGVQSVEIPFPFNGTINKITANCQTPSITNVEIDIDKTDETSYDANTGWNSILGNHLFIDGGNKSSKNSLTQYSIIDNVINLGDIFRLNILSSDGVMENLTVSIEVII